MTLLKNFVIGYALQAMFVLGAIVSICWLLWASDAPSWWFAAPLVAAYWYLWGRAFLKHDKVAEQSNDRNEEL